MSNNYLKVVKILNDGGKSVLEQSIVPFDDKCTISIRAALLKALMFAQVLGVQAITIFKRVPELPPFRTVGSNHPYDSNGRPMLEFERNAYGAAIELAKNWRH